MRLGIWTDIEVEQEPLTDLASLVDNMMEKVVETTDGLGDAMLYCTPDS